MQAWWYNWREFFPNLTHSNLWPNWVKHQWCNRQREGRGGEGDRGKSVPNVFYQEIFADLMRKQRQGKQEIGEEKKQNCRRGRGNLMVKSAKWANDFCFVFCLSFLLKITKFCFGCTNMQISTGKSISLWEKYGKMWLGPSEKDSSCLCTDVVYSDFNMSTNTTCPKLTHYTHPPIPTNIHPYPIPTHALDSHTQWLPFNPILFNASHQAILYRPNRAYPNDITELARACMQIRDSGPNNTFLLTHILITSIPQPHTQNGYLENLLFKKKSL